MRLLRLVVALATLTTVAVVAAVTAEADSVGPPWGPAGTERAARAKT